MEGLGTIIVRIRPPCRDEDMSDVCHNNGKSADGFNAAILFNIETRPKCVTSTSRQLTALVQLFSSTLRLDRPKSGTEACHDVIETAGLIFTVTIIIVRIRPPCRDGDMAARHLGSIVVRSRTWRRDQK